MGDSDSGFLNIVKSSVALGLAFLIGSGLIPSDELPDNAPDGAVYYAESKTGSLTLFEEEVVFIQRGSKYAIALKDVKKAIRRITIVRIVSDDGVALEFNFLSVLQAKDFEDKLSELL